MSFFDDLSAIGVVPVVSIEDARDALPLADALPRRHQVNHWTVLLDFNPSLAQFKPKPSLPS